MITGSLQQLARAPATIALLPVVQRYHQCRYEYSKLRFTVRKTGVNLSTEKKGS